MHLFFSKWPSKSQWLGLPKLLDRKEKIILLVLSVLFITSFIFLAVHFYLKNTEIVPSQGGIYTEGILGSPRFINPVFAASSDADRDLTQLIYSGLLKYDGQGKLQPDLAQNYKILADNQTYEFYLKENLFWQDGKPITSDDVIFTVKTIQNPSFKSPLRAGWLGVDVEKISDLGVRFTLKNPSAVFLENCTLKILPQHIWQDISSQNFPLSVYNLKPIGSGPYKVKNVSQDKDGNIKSLELGLNQNYYGLSPNIPRIIFYFFETEDELISAFKNKQIVGASVSDWEKSAGLDKNKTNEYRLDLPRYFAVFFNPENAKVLTDKNVRQALNYATDKKEILAEALSNEGKVVDSPILPDIYGFKTPETIYTLDLDKAKQLLTAAGFAETASGTQEKVVQKTPAFQFKSNLRLGSQGNEVQELQKCLAKDTTLYPGGEITGYFGQNTKAAVIKFQEKYKDEILTPAGLGAGTGEVLKATRDKLNAICAAPSQENLSLSFTLTTVNQPILKKVAELLKTQWQKIGVNLDIQTIDAANFTEEIIRPRNYEMILFGEVLTMTPDLYPFWHSSQIKDPGLNLADYQNKDADKLLEDARQSTEASSTESSLEKFQDILIADAPAVFLYSPDYLYLVSKDIKGIDVKIITDPSQRFTGIEKWYIKTKRVWR